MSKLTFTWLLLILPLFNACSNLTYYSQAIAGQLEIFQRSHPISNVLTDPTITPSLKQQLTNVLAIRQFATQELHLPDNPSYTYYADLQRPFVVWSVFAAPTFSLQPKQWCFLIIGCVSYRGYFTQTQALALADSLRAEGYDVYVAGIAAYSTLGWFSDPVLNTMLSRWNLAQVAGIIFHELAHQQIYVPNDTAFNEAFAMTVEYEGVKRWLAHHGTPKDWQTYQEEQQRDTEFIQLILTTQDRLEAIYQQSWSAEQKLSKKSATFAKLQQDYQHFKQRWQNYPGYDKWMSEELNNAKLLSVVTYQQQVPAFQALLAQVNGDLPTFYQRVAELGKLPAEQRLPELQTVFTRPKSMN